MRSIRADDLKRLRVPVRKALPFLIFPDHSPGRLIDRLDDLRKRGVITETEFAEPTWYDTWNFTGRIPQVIRVLRNQGMRQRMRA